MEIKRPKIKSMKYEDFNDNEYLEQMVRELRENGTNVVAGCLDEVINWGRSNSLWPLTFATSCCGIEFMAVLEPGTKTNLCVPGADAVAAQIAALLGVEAEDVVEKIAVVQCAGTCEATSVKADYRGIPSCAAAKLFYGGNGSCIFGCMGFGDCARACPKNAISMQDGIACVDHTACIGCGICAQTCPQKIIEIVPASYQKPYHM